MNEEVYVHIMDGMTVNEAVTENEDGSYSVFVNADLCEQKQFEAMNHALKHIEHGDFSRASVQEIEAVAHD